MTMPVVENTLTKALVQKRICLAMIAKFIRNFLKKLAQRILDLDKRKFQFKHASDRRIEEYRPMMLKLIYNMINPSTCFGIINLVNKLDWMNLEDFDQDVPKMINTYERTYNMIIEKEGAYSNQVSLLFDTLLTSTNKDFYDFVNDNLDKW